jgi:hypothetical protein
VVGVADEQDLETLGRVPHGLGVHLGHQRARGVDGREVALDGLPPQGRAHAVGAEHDDRPHRHLVEIVHEAHAAVPEPLHDVFVVDDLVMNVDRPAKVHVHELIDHVDRHVHTGTETTRIGQDELHAVRAPFRVVIIASFARSFACRTQASS